MGNVSGSAGVSVRGVGSEGGVRGVGFRLTALLQLVRVLCHLVAVVVVTVWGVVVAPFDVPGFIGGGGVLCMGLLWWALFLSPRPVLRTDRFVVSIVELVFFALAVASLLHLGVFWVWPLVFGGVSVIVGYLVVLRQL